MPRITLSILFVLFSVSVFAQPVLPDSNTNRWYVFAGYNLKVLAHPKTNDAPAITSTSLNPSYSESTAGTGLSLGVKYKFNNDRFALIYNSGLRYDLVQFSINAPGSFDEADKEFHTDHHFLLRKYHYNKSSLHYGGGVSILSLGKGHYGWNHEYDFNNNPIVDNHYWQSLQVVSFDLEVGWENDRFDTSIAFMFAPDENISYLDSAGNFLSLTINYDIFEIGRNRNRESFDLN